MPDDRVTDRRGFLHALSGLVLGASPDGSSRVTAPGRELPPVAGAAAELPLVSTADPARLIPHVRLLVAAAATLGAPSSAVAWSELEAACSLADAMRIQRVIDRACLADVQINPEMRVRVGHGPVRPLLRPRAWCAFLVKVRNESGTTARLHGAEAGAGGRSAGWLEVRLAEEPPLSPTLSGAEVEYRIVLLHARDAGWREASLTFDVGQGTQDIGFRNELPILFDCRSAR